MEMVMRCRMALGIGLLLLASLERASAQELASLPVYQSGALPDIPFHSMAVGGGEVLLEVTVTETGAVGLVRPLRVTPSFDGPLIEAVRSWRFSPAQIFLSPAERKPGGPDRRPVESKVLVGGWYRPPALYSGTLGEPTKDIAAASPDSPSLRSSTLPTFPANAYSPGVVMVELRLDPNGTVAGSRVVQSAPPFDDAALGAARQWTFDPARPRGVRSDSAVYIIFGFPRPVGLSVGSPGH
jgi:TonB family protein